MDRHEEVADIYSVLKPVFFTSKILGLAPYIVVGDTSRTKIRVSALAIVYSLAVSILIVGLLGYRQFKITNLWENICNSGENILVLGTSCCQVLAYLTLLLRSRRIARLFDHLNCLVEETSYSAWKKDLHTMLSIQIFAAIMVVIAAVMEFSVIAKEFNTVMRLTYFYIAEFCCFVSENQFVSIIIVLKHVVQKWNFHICAVSEKEDPVNLPYSTEYVRKEGPNLFTISNKLAMSNRADISSMVTYFRYIRKQHASACEAAERVNSIYSAVLLFAVARVFISLTHTLYYIVMHIFVQKMSFLCDTRENYSYFVWLLYYAVRLIWLVYFTSFTSKEVSHKFHYFDMQYLKGVPDTYNLPLYSNNMP
jgi:hypothetical protein